MWVSSRRMCWGWLPPVAAVVLYMLYLSSKMSRWMSHTVSSQEKGLGFSKLLLFPGDVLTQGSRP